MVVHQMPEVDEPTHLVIAASDLYEALRSVESAAESVPDGSFYGVWDESLNPDAHYEITLTIGEVRAMINALAKARGKARR